LITILLLCLARTESRGAWLGLAVGVVLIAWQPGRYRRYAAILGGGLLVAAVAFLYWAGHLSALYSSSQIGNVDRWDMWTAAWEMIKDRPVLGQGLNTFMANYLDYWVGGERMPRYAHNCYLQVAAETGLIGLGAFLWVLGALFARVVTAIRRAPHAEQALLVGWCAGLAAFVVQATVDTNFYSLRQAALFWILSGAAVGLSMRATETPMR
jgi:O-antigen ligase